MTAATQATISPSSFAVVPDDLVPAGVIPLLYNCCASCRAREIARRS